MATHDTANASSSQPVEREEAASDSLDVPNTRDPRNQQASSLEEASRMLGPSRYNTPMAASPLPARPPWAVTGGYLEGSSTDANVVTISDRRVRLPGPGTEAPSLYALMRAWVRNAPDIPYVQEPYIVRPSGRRWDEAVDGPAPEAVPVYPEPPPLEMGLSDPVPSVEQLLDHNLDHWKACRELRRGRQRAGKLPAASVEHLSRLLRAQEKERRGEDLGNSCAGVPKPEPGTNAMEV